MRTMRQDAWTTEDDRILADILIRHIRQGSTQLAAFEEAASLLGRTAAACGYRWNAVVRGDHREAIALAKADRKNSMSRIRKEVITNSPLFYESESEIMVQSTANRTGNNLEKANPSWLQILNILRSYKKQHESVLSCAKQYEAVAQQKEQLIGELKAEVESLRAQMEVLQVQHDTIKNEYYSLLNIVDRARRMSEETST